MYKKIANENLFYLYSVLISIAFLTQPIGLRIYNISYALLLFSLNILINLKSGININKISIIFTPLFLILIIDYIYSFDNRLLAIIICLAYVILNSQIKITYRNFIYIITSIYLVSIFLLLYGVYGYIYGSELINTYNPNGLLGIIGYYEFSIGYIPGGRNTDVLYLCTGLIIGIYFIMQDKLKLINGAMCCIFLIAIIGTSSRGAWISLFLSLIILLRLRLLIYIIYPILSIGLIYIFSSILDNYINVSLNTFLSIFGYESTITAYKPSNNERVDIIYDNIDRFFDMPYGRGLSSLADYNAEYNYKYNNNWVISENSYLDIIVGFGIYGIFIIIYIISVAVKLIIKSGDDSLRLVQSIITLVIISALFNDLLNFYYYYFLIATSLAYINYRDYEE